MVAFAQRITRSAWFKNLIIGLILMSGAISGVETYLGSTNESSSVRDVLLIAQDVILWVFVAEIVLKLVACGKQPWRFFANGWNLFDFLIVAVCLLPFDSQFATVFRMVRLVRVLRLITILPKLQLLVGSIPSCGYIGILLGLHFYIYAVTGTSLFRENDPVRFGTLHESFLTLFQVLTLEGWNDTLNTAYLGSDVTYDDSWKVQTDGVRRSIGQPLTAAAYFVSFIMLGTMIMLNLFTGVIIASMEEAASEASDKDLEQRIQQRGFLTLRDELELLSRRLTEIAGSVADLQRRTEPFSPSDLSGSNPSPLGSADAEFNRRQPAAFAAEETVHQ